MHKDYRSFERLLRYGYTIKLGDQVISHCNPVHLSHTYANTLAQEVMRELMKDYTPQEQQQISFQITDSSALLNSLSQPRIAELQP